MKLDLLSPVSLLASPLEAVPRCEPTHDNCANCQDGIDLDGHSPRDVTPDGSPLCATCARAGHAAEGSRETSVEHYEDLAASGRCAS